MIPVITVLKENFQWLTEHADLGNNKMWHCKEHGTQMQTRAVHRFSIGKKGVYMLVPEESGNGSMVTFLFFSCTECTSLHAPHSITMNDLVLASVY